METQWNWFETTRHQEKDCKVLKDDAVLWSLSSQTLRKGNTKDTYTT